MVVFASVGWIAAIIKAVLVGLISLLGSGIDTILRIPVADSPVVANAWTIVRNFANMLFIIALIVMAFGTIFSIQGYDVRNLIARFLIAALLINFSLVIGTLVIQGSQVLANTFLTPIGDLLGRIGQVMNLSKLLPGV